MTVQSYVSVSAPEGITVDYFQQLVEKFGGEDVIPLSEIDIVEFRRIAG
jgi:hypothetical protein